jgi:hypothetical protein
VGWQASKGGAVREHFARNNLKSLNRLYPEAPRERRTKMYSGGSGWRMESVQMDSIETAEEIGFIL